MTKEKLLELIAAALEEADVALIVISDVEASLEAPEVRPDRVPPLEDDDICRGWG